MSLKDCDSRVFPRDASLSTRRAVSAQGCYVVDSSGKRYLDGSGEAAVSAFGHNHPLILKVGISFCWRRPT
jgi:4-aminobutyrate aminotransferase-like enzyme